MIIFQKLMYGVTLAAPLGPVSVEMIKRGLEGGFWPAFNIRLGGAIGNVLCLIAAFWGLSAIQDMPWLKLCLGFTGSLVLIYMGYSNLIKGLKPITLDYLSDSTNKKMPALKASLGLGFILAVLNPVAVVFWLTIFANDVPLDEPLTLNHLAMNSFIIVGVLLWGAFLSGLLEFTRRALSPSVFKWVTLGSGIILLYFGLKYGLKNISDLALLAQFGH